MSNPQLYVLDEAQAKALGQRLCRATFLLMLLVRHVNLEVVYANMQANGLEELAQTVLEQVEQAEADLDPSNLDRLDQQGRVVKARSGPVPIRQGVAHV